MRPSTAGLSMVEMVISMTLFGVIMAAVLQSMVNTTNYVEFDATRTDLQTESMRFQNEVINDLANAAWFYRFDPVGDVLYRDSSTGLREALFPTVASDGSRLEFLKLRSSLMVAESPAEERYAFTNFRATTTAPVDFSAYVDATPTALMVMNPDYRADPQWYVASVWESSKVGLDFDDNQDPELLRHYLYCVEAGADGTRNLVRKYLNGYSGAQPAISAWKLDAILLRDVETVKFSTITEDENLNENQIRIQITMERGSGRSAVTGATVSRVLDFTAAMRSINQEN